MKLIGYQEEDPKSIVMEMCDGNLSQLFLTKKNRTEFLSSYALHLQALLDIAKACQYIHQCGAIHFDIKTDNILFQRTGRLKYVFKVSDFGVR